MDGIKTSPLAHPAAFGASGEPDIDAENGQQTGCGLPRPLEVVVADFVRQRPQDDGKLAILLSILQSIDDSVSRTIKGMALSPEEQKFLEEKQAAVRKMKLLAKQQKLDEQEATEILERMLSDEDKKLLDEQYAEQQAAYA